MTLRAYTSVIEPTTAPSTGLLNWAYLIRVDNFAIQLNKETLIYVGDSDEVWSEVQESMQAGMVSKLISYVGEAK